MRRGVFISYSSKDHDFVQRLAEDLKKRDIPVWFDETDLEPGDSIIGAIEAVIDEMEFLVVVLSPASVDSGWVTKEIRMVLQKGIAGKKVSILPVLRQECQIPGFLRDLKYVDMRSDRDYPAGLERLARKISRGLEFKDSLQELTDGLKTARESGQELDGEFEATKGQYLDQAISLAEKALRGELNENEWKQAAAPVMLSLGHANVSFDQRNQRAVFQINIGNLNLHQPVAPQRINIDDLGGQEADFRKRIQQRFAEDASYYVPLSGETTEVDKKTAVAAAPRSAQRRLKRMQAEYREWIQEGEKLKRVKLNTLREGVDKYPCIILLGDPGCGKTTALQHLAYELAGENGRLPLALRLSEFAPGMSIEDFTVNGLAGPESAGHWQAPELADNLTAYLEGGKLFCLFDALNEMPHTGYGNRVQALRSFINKWSPKGNRFLVTCRVLDYGEELSGLQRVEIQPLHNEQIQEFVKREMPATWKDLWRELTSEGEDERSLLKLARNPYMLTVMIDVFDEDGRLGENRSALMTRFTEILMEWCRQKCPADEWLDPDVQRAALAVMAFEVQDRAGFGTMLKTALAKAVMPGKICLDPKFPPVPSPPPDRVLRLAASAHIIEMTGDRSSLRFYHQLLQEYFAAREMLKRDSADLDKLWKWPWLENDMPKWVRPERNYDPLPPPPPTNWEETTIMAAGLIPENDDQLLRAVVEINPVLAGRCLYEGKAEVGLDTCQTVIERLLAAISDPKVALRVRIAAGEVLGYLGDPRIGELVTIPAGEFLMGDDKGSEREKPHHKLFLPEYQIGKYLITNFEFNEFIEAGGYREKRWWTETGLSSKKENNWTEPKWWDEVRYNKPNQPVVGVTWYECLAYCRWRSEESSKIYRLPTEAKWEKAARGTDDRQYPWGKEFEPERLNSSEGDQIVKATTPVAIYPTGVSPYGCLDMAGNVWEWTRSLWGTDFEKPSYGYPYQPKDGRENLEAGNDVFRVLRGGSWLDYRDLLRCSFRLWSRPRHRLDCLGFRVVVSHSFGSSVF